MFSASKGLSIRQPVISGPSSNKGFTLLEVMVALMILSGVIVTIITTVNYHLRAVDNIESITTATLLAREKIEDINLNGLPLDKEGDFSPGFTGFRWSYYAEDLPIAGIKKVYLTVTWGKGDKVTIETYRLQS